MLDARRLPEILQNNLTDGVDGICLMTDSGSIIGSAMVKNTKVTESGFAAISSSIWGNYSEGCDLRFQLIKFEHGYLGITTAGKGYLISAFGENVPPGLLKGRLEVLRTYFSNIFEKIK